MLGRNKKIWTHYDNNISAVDIDSADFTSSYIKYTIKNGNHFSNFEVLDLQTYKRIHKPKLVQQAFRERLQVPFVFATCKN